MPAPSPECYIVPGSLAELFIAQDPEAATLEWIKIGDLDNYSLSSDSTDTSLNTGGWIRSLPMERGLSLTATGRLSTLDPGQVLVKERALEVGCGALSYYRFVIPGANPGDPAYLDWGFWAWANMQDNAAASTDPFSWGVALRFWSKPDDLVDGQPVARAAAPQPAARQQRAPAASTSSASAA